MNLRNRLSLAIVFCFCPFLLYSQTNHIESLDFLKKNGKTPTEYVLSKFGTHDLILLGEDHGVKDHLDFVKDLIPDLYKHGVYNLCLEFGAFEMQSQLDSLVNAENYNEDLARNMMFFYNTGWPYKEYMDIYKEAWKLNKSLPENARKFRVVNISYQYDWSKFQNPRNSEVMSRVFHRGTPDDFRARIIEKEIISKREKAIVFMGSVHVFTKYRFPILKVNNDDFCDYDTGFVGSRLYRKYPNKVFNIMLHFPMEGKDGYPVSPAKGEIESIMNENGNRPIAFDLDGTPIGELTDNSYFSLCYKNFRMKDFIDGYIFIKPFKDLQGCTIDTLFYEGRIWSDIKRQMPDPNWHTAENIDEYKEQTRKYVDLKARYNRIIQQSIPSVSHGKISRYNNFPSQFVAPRNVDVWLPDDYSRTKSYNVLYMHDGQMLFDSTITWNKQEWNVDETVGKLIKEGEIKNCIVVGVWNIPEKRFADYFPQKVVNNILEPAKSLVLEKQINGEPNADNYLKFLVTELKPFIDNNYSTKTDRESTFIMGSSMGGLISMYAICEYPQVFGGAACLSIHSPLIIPGSIDETTDKFVASKLREYLLSNLPKANTRKIYMDYGDQTLDAYYGPYQKKIDEVMKEKGWRYPYWETKFYPGTSHSEEAWAKRLSIPLEFLMGTK